MTTIVATTEGLYADSYCDYVSPFSTNKLAHVKSPLGGNEYLVGGAGNLVEFQLYCNIIKQYGTEALWQQHFGENWPPKILVDAETELIMLDKNGQIMLMGRDLIPVHVNEAYFAIGTGADLALAAMDHGANAMDAVEYACTRDTSSKPPVTEIKFP